MEERENITTTRNASPFSGQLPALQMGWGNAMDLLSRGSYAPRSHGILRDRIAGDLVGDAQAQQAQNRLAAVAAGGELWEPTETLRAFEAGHYADPASNPFLRSSYNQAAGAVGAQMDSLFQGAGRYGSGAWADQRSRALGNLANDMYSRAYEGGQNRMLAASQLINQGNQGNRSRMLQAAGMLPAYQMARYEPLRLSGQLEQGEIDAPWRDLARYMGAVGGNYGSSESATQPYASNPAGQVLGGLGSAATALYLGSRALGPILGKDGLDVMSWFGGGDSFMPNIDLTGSYNPLDVGSFLDFGGGSFALT